MTALLITLILAIAILAIWLRAITKDVAKLARIARNEREVAKNIEGILVVHGAALKLLSLGRQSSDRPVEKPTVH